jgi:hypothetical protein
LTFEKIYSHNCLDNLLSPKLTPFALGSLSNHSLEEASSTGIVVVKV